MFRTFVRFWTSSYSVASNDSGAYKYSQAICSQGNTLIFSCHDKQYADIWDIDEKDPLVGPEGGESVKDVACRLTRAMTTMESEFEGQ